MNLLSMFTGNWKKNGTAASDAPAPVAPAPPVIVVPAVPNYSPTALEERQRLLAHHVRLVARGMANGLCVYGSRGGLGKTRVVLATLKEEGGRAGDPDWTLHAAGDVHGIVRTPRIRRLSRRLRRDVPQSARPRHPAERACGKGRRAIGW